ncbi:MAG TPA: hypothetical protein VFI02_03695 [Armatimonadota bacterium]|nr:hypothetical protein [Armatimonadota bacterium]
MDKKVLDALDARFQVAIEEMGNVTISLSALIKKQDATNGLIRELIDTNKQFISTLTSFLKEDHKIKVDREKSALEQARERLPTPDDLRY